VLTATYHDVVWEFLERRFKPLRHAEERLARAAGCTPRTARGWLRQEHAPQGEHLLALMAECGDLARDIMQAVEDRRCGRSSASSGDADGSC